MQEIDFNAVKTIPVQPDLPLCGVVGGRDIREVATTILLRLQQTGSRSVSRGDAIITCYTHIQSRIKNDSQKSKYYYIRSRLFDRRRHIKRPIEMIRGLCTLIINLNSPQPYMS
jgi:hypothetical protein